jgi:hypothetical protein
MGRYLCRNTPHTLFSVQIASNTKIVNKNMHLNKQLKSRLKKHKQNTREIIGNPITKYKDTKEIQYVKLKRGRNSIW